MLRTNKFIKLKITPKLQAERLKSIKLSRLVPLNYTIECYIHLLTGI